MSALVSKSISSTPRSTSLTVAPCETPLALAPVVASLPWRATTGPSFPASVSVATVSLLPSSRLPSPILPRNPVSDQRLLLHCWTPVHPSLRIRQRQGRSKIPLITASQHARPSMSCLEEVDRLVVDVEVVDAAT